MVEPNKTAALSLAILAAGAGGERFDEAVKRIVENIRDTNTDAKAKRKITLELIFQPMDESREAVQTVLNVKVTAPNMKAWQSAMFVERGANGQLQFTTNVPQRHLDDEISAVAGTITPERKTSTP